MTIRDVIEAHGHFAHGGNPDDTTETWEACGFEAHEVEEWLRARCFDPNTARDLADAGVTPELAAMRTEMGRGDYTDTVGFKVSDGDLEVEEARDLLGVT
jgi:2-polyprenyl-6-methoxyphenol hydroxylase-like FAD-dependent oxidoreductase